MESRDAPIPHVTQQLIWNQGCPNPSRYPAEGDGGHGSAGPSGGPERGYIDRSCGWGSRAVAPSRGGWQGRLIAWPLLDRKVPLSCREKSQGGRGNQHQKVGL